MRSSTTFLVLLSSFAASFANCPDGYVSHGTHCYHFSTDQETWADAMIMCRLDGGTLAEIDDAAENNYLQSTAHQKRGEFWVGGADRLEEGVWKWMTSGTPISSSLRNWFPGEPNNLAGDEDCLVLNYINHWDDRPCHFVRKYICEIMSRYCEAALHAPTPPPSTSLQQCAANLACSIDYNNIFQTKLDNVSHYTELEIALFRHQVNNILQPLQSKVQMLETNSTAQVTALNNQMTTVLKELAYDREFLGNLTRGLYILNDDFHKESGIRYQDIHNLVLTVDDVKAKMATLQGQVNQLLGVPNATPTAKPTGTAAPLLGTNAPQTNSPPQTQPCIGTVKDAYVQELEKNLTYFKNAQLASEKALANIRALEKFLQGQVVQLKGNLTKAQNDNHLKDQVIVHLQQQMQNILNSPSLPPLIGACRGELGVKSGVIPDSAITASQSQPGYGPEHARIDNPQGWYTPERQTSNDWLQIDTGSLNYITKIATQGAPCCDVMVTNYTVQFSEDGRSWKEYQHGCVTRYLKGNSDKDTVVTNELEVPVLGRYIRLNVVEFKKNGQSNYVGMRVELYGCDGVKAG